ncbi:hypothetical protein ACFSKX_00855 [Microbulbifer halophilus]|uniref:DUF2127 domain-containing protein n=1 Tax=Microbulbifer halophilus TaxID=453963 RepID=A0ABW5E6J8_9GAMM
MYDSRMLAFLSDTYPNSLAIIVSAILVVILYEGRNFLPHFSSYTLGILLYEFLQVVLPEGTFDIMDLLMTAIMYLMVVLIWVLAQQRAILIESSGDRVAAHKDANHK